MHRPDALTLANTLDEAWHDQPRSFEREALTRFWGLLTLPARILDPAAPSKMLRSAAVLRNARFTGAPALASPRNSDCARSRSTAVLAGALRNTMLELNLDRSA